MYIYFSQECWRWESVIMTYPSIHLMLHQSLSQTFRRRLYNPSIHPSSCRSELSMLLHCVRAWPVTLQRVLADIKSSCSRQACFQSATSLPRCPWCILMTPDAAHHCQEKVAKFGDTQQKQLRVKNIFNFGLKFNPRKWCVLMVLQICVSVIYFIVIIWSINP